MPRDSRSRPDRGRTDIAVEHLEQEPTAAERARGAREDLEIDRELRQSTLENAARVVRRLRDPADES